MSALDALAWPDDRVAEAVVALGRASGLPLDDAPRAGDPSGGGRVTPDTVTTRKALLSWVAFSAEQVGLEAEQVGCSYRELDKLLLALGPALLPLAREGQDTLRFLALLPGGRAGSPS